MAKKVKRAAKKAYFDPNGRIERVTLKDKRGNADIRAVRVSTYDVTQVEIYIPNAILNSKITKRFLKMIDEVEEGESRLGSVSGVWRGKKEKTTIIRKIFARPKAYPGSVSEVIRGEVRRYVAELSQKKKLAQDAVWFTETVSTLSAVDYVKAK